MPLEIERKYRVTSLGGLELPPGECIDQGYLATNDNTVRVRLKNDRAFLTIKCAPPDTAEGNGAVVCQEFEYEIPVADARSILNATPFRIVKTRHHMDNGVEIDVFHGRHKGLILAEYESSDGAQAPTIPGVEWVEVSSDRRYSNAWMSCHGVPPLDDQ